MGLKFMTEENDNQRLDILREDAVEASSSKVESLETFVDNAIYIRNNVIIINLNVIKTILI